MKITPAQIKAATEVFHLVDRALRAHEADEPDGTLIRELETRAAQGLGLILSGQEDLEVDVDGLSLTLRGHVLVEAGEGQEPIGKCLFQQGIERIVLSRGIAPAEVISLVEAWAAAHTGRGDDEQSFLTSVWDEGLEHVFVHGREPYTPDPNTTVDERRAAEERLDRTKALVDDRRSKDDRGSMSEIAHHPLGRADLRRAADSVSAADARDLGARILRLHGLATPVTPHWQEGLAMDAERAVERAVALAQALGPDDGRDAEAQKVSKIVSRIVVYLLGRGEVDAALSVVRASKETRSRTGTTADAWQRLVKTLETHDVQEVILRHVDRQPQACVALLEAAPDAKVDLMLERLATLEQPGARAALVRVVAARRPTAEQVSAAVKAGDVSLFRVLLQVLPGASPGVALAAYRTALEHTREDVRDLALASVPADLVSHLVGAYRPLVLHADKDSRRVARDIVVRAKDEGAVDNLAQLFFERRSDALEKRTLVAALGKIASARAGVHLRSILDSNADVELRAAAALALSQVGDAASVKALEAVAAKGLFGRKRLKEAAREALDRIGRRGPAPQEEALVEIDEDSSDEDTEDADTDSGEEVDDEDTVDMDSDFGDKTVEIEDEEEP